MVRRGVTLGRRVRRVVRCLRSVRRAASCRSSAGRRQARPGTTLRCPGRMVRRGVTLGRRVRRVVRCLRSVRRAASCRSSARPGTRGLRPSRVATLPRRTPVRLPGLGSPGLRPSTVRRWRNRRVPLLRRVRRRLRWGTRCFRWVARRRGLRPLPGRRPRGRRAGPCRRPGAWSVRRPRGRTARRAVRCRSTPGHRLLRRHRRARNHCVRRNSSPRRTGRCHDLRGRRSSRNAPTAGSGRWGRRAPGVRRRRVGPVTAGT